MVSRAGIRRQPRAETALPHWGRKFLRPLPLDIVRIVIAQAMVAGSAWIVLNTLLMHADCSGYVTAPRDDIASFSRLDRDTVTRTLRQLREAGEVKQVRRGAGHRPGEWQIARIDPLSGEGGAP